MGVALLLIVAIALVDGLGEVEGEAERDDDPLIVLVAEAEMDRLGDSVNEGLRLIVLVAVNEAVFDADID